MPSPTDQKNDAAAVMLCSILTPQPETTQLEDDEYHDHRNTFDTAGFSAGNLMDARANPAYEGPNNTCMTDQQFQQIAHLVNPRLALAIKLDSWNHFGITTTAWEKDHHPNTLRRLEENPPLIHQPSKTGPMDESTSGNQVHD